MAAATSNTNTDRNDAAFLAARNDLAQKLLSKRTAYARERVGVAQTLANAVANAGNGIGVIAGAAPAMRDNFGVAFQAQRELQAARTAAYALKMAEKVLKE